MIAASQPVQRPGDARLLVVFADGRIAHAPRSQFVEFLRPGDLVIANDAATIPASLHGVHLRSGEPIEIRLAAWLPQRSSGDLSGDHLNRRSGDQEAFSFSEARFLAVAFGAGDFRTRTEDRALPPRLAPGDRLVLGPLVATVEALLDHPRLVSLRFTAPASDVWAGLARHGRPIQYAHVAAPLALWDVWTPLAGVPASFEPPSAGFALDWAAIRGMRQRGVSFATLTQAAGISSTGDAALDRRLPFDEAYAIPAATAAAIRRARSNGGRVIAVGTTVVRALEHAARRTGAVRSGRGVANQRLGPFSRLRVVDAILSGTHEPGSSHYQLLRAFADDETLAAASAALDAARYRTHEFGDSVLIETDRLRARRRARGPSTPLGAGRAARRDGYWLSNKPSTLPSVSAMRA
jgi:S-adenosylmethionine:tRNA ribosyltransferase-isomerase